MKPKAILVDVIPKETSKQEAETRLKELEQLINTYGGVAVIKIFQKRGLPDYETYIGKGKVKEIIEIAKEEDARLVILNNIAKPAQIYNLSERMRKDTKAEVWDRVDLILNIFDKYAKSAEAKLQIELAKIRHMGPRISGMGTELMRQEGRTGVRSGQGESNIEMMKRHLRTQELKILEKLKHYETINEGHRKRRQRQNFHTAALVGYTNAGKSTIMQALTGKKVYIANELFATLDTRVAKVYMPEHQSELLISDTIGFIQDLPPSLIKAFKSTLSETVEADLILHVIDASDPQMEMKIQVVEDILKQLKADKKPKIYIFNKTDLVNLQEQAPGEPEQIRPIGLMVAGKQTAKILGWQDKDTPHLSLQEIKTKYSKYTPIFISALDKGSKDQLKNVLTKRLK